MMSKNETAVGVPTSTQADAPPPPVPSAAELAALRSSVFTARDLLASLKLASMDTKVGVSMDPSTLQQISVEGSAPLWDRADFLVQTAAAVVALTQLLDEHVADAFAGARVSSRVASAIRDLHARAERPVLADAARVTTVVKSLVDPLRPQANPVVLRAATAFVEASFGARLSDEADPTQMQEAHAVVDAWLRSLLESGECSEGGVSDLSTPNARGALAKLVAQHMKLTLWPLAVDANIAWSIGGTEDAEGVRTVEGAVPTAAIAREVDPVALVALGEDHQLFSLDGSTVAGGAAVYEVGPALCARVPLWGGGGGAATPQQLAELRAGARCRTIVVKA